MQLNLTTITNTDYLARAPQPIDLNLIDSDDLPSADQDPMMSWIARQGLLTPLAVQETGSGRYRLIAGRRRLNCLRALVAKEWTCWDRDRQRSWPASWIYSSVPCLVLGEHEEVGE